MSKRVVNSQLTFESLFENKCNYPSNFVCHDYFGDEISVGDYVIGYTGTPKKENLEGYVIEITEYENGPYLKIATLTGKIIAHSEHPNDYIISKKKN